MKITMDIQDKYKFNDIAMTLDLDEEDNTISYIIARVRDDGFFQFIDKKTIKIPKVEK